MLAAASANFPPDFLTANILFNRLPFRSLRSFVSENPR